MDAQSIRGIILPPYCQVTGLSRHAHRLNAGYTKMKMKADVVVVGGGGTGLAAAIGAATDGARVVLLEKNPKLGGTTARSIGSISATQTSHQKREGISDTPDEHFEDMAKFSKQHANRPDNEELARLLVDNVPETVRWLSAMGVEFFGPLEEPPHRKPRMHQIMPNSAAYIFHLERHARSIGVNIITDARVQRLLVSDEEVTGVEFLRGDGAVETVEAARGVILAAGDYAADAAFKGKFISPAVAATEAVNPTNTGDGHRMALELGARIINQDMYGGGMRFVRPAQPAWQSRLPPLRWLMRPANFLLRVAPKSVVRRFLMGFLTTVVVPQKELFQDGAILINKLGERFADETKGMVFDLAYQPDGIGYILFDAAVAAKYTQWPHYVSTAPGIAFAYLQDYEKNRPDLFHRAETLEALAGKLGMDSGVLKRAVDAYNVANATESEGRRPALTRGPFHVLGPVRNYINYTDGGLAISTGLQVLGANDVPIPRLYAAGATGQGGLLLKGHGNHLGWGFTSGRLAGQYAAQLAPRTE
jgi:succinate dehydrogenase/fumarate reductase flavoprotein subunit